jgi:hypothetical protein
VAGELTFKAKILLPYIEMYPNHPYACFMIMHSLGDRIIFMIFSLIFTYYLELRIYKFPLTFFDTITVEDQLVKFDRFVQPDVLFTVP